MFCPAQAGVEIEHLAERRFLGRVGVTGRERDGVGPRVGGAQARHLLGRQAAARREVRGDRGAEGENGGNETGGESRWRRRTPAVFHASFTPGVVTVRLTPRARGAPVRGAAARAEAPGARPRRDAGGAGRRLLRPVRRPVGAGHVRRVRVADVPRRPRHDGARGLQPPRRLRLLLRHRHDGLARRRRLRHGGRGRRAARDRDGGVEAGRGLLRALRLLLPLPAGLGLHPAPHPVGRDRRAAEAADHLHRRLLPARHHGGGRRGRRAARPGRGRLHAGCEAVRHRRPRPPPGGGARHRRESCGSCWAGPGPTSSSPS